MVLQGVLERFIQKAPVTVMARAVMEHALGADDVDAVFDAHADSQYERELLFSTVVDLLSCVVTRSRPSLHAAWKAVKGTVPVSVTSLYNKVSGVEPVTSAALVKHTADKLAPVITSMGGQFPPQLSGYQVRIIDGNHLGATERRIDVLKGSSAGPLPGQTLAVLCPSLMLITHLILCEDGHAQERSMTDQILALVDTLDVWVADRNFCTARLLYGIWLRGAFFVIRQHATNVVWEAAGQRREVGRTDGGMVYEQTVLIHAEGADITARRVTVELDKPDRDGETAVHILTNLPPADASGVTIAEIYRGRWAVETAFHDLTVHLQCELNTLGYPRAALLGFCVAVAAYNVLATVKAAVRSEFGHQKVKDEFSGFYLAEEIASTYQGMLIALPPEDWTAFAGYSAPQMGEALRRMAKNINLDRFKKSKRGPKKPVPERTRFRGKPHVSTARLLAERKGAKIPP